MVITASGELREVLLDLKRQLEWRGPTTGKPQKTICLRRVDAQLLFEQFEIEPWNTEKRL